MSLRTVFKTNRCIHNYFRYKDGMSKPLLFIKIIVLGTRAQIVQITVKLQ